MGKHELSVFYGVDETLPDEEFMRQIREINELARMETERMRDVSHLQNIQETAGETRSYG